eukprot:4062492-Prymnesium_polylepis.2
MKAPTKLHRRWSTWRSVNFSSYDSIVCEWLPHWRSDQKAERAERSGECCRAGCWVRSPMALLLAHEVDEARERGVDPEYRTDERTVQVLPRRRVPRAPARGVHAALLAPACLLEVGAQVEVEDLDQERDPRHEEALKQSNIVGIQKLLERAGDDRPDRNRDHPLVACLHVANVGWDRELEQRREARRAAVLLEAREGDGQQEGHAKVERDRREPERPKHVVVRRESGRGDDAEEGHEQHHEARLTDQQPARALDVVRHVARVDGQDEPQPHIAEDKVLALHLGVGVARRQLIERALLRPRARARGVRGE